MVILWIIIGAILGGAVAESEGVAFGAFLGFLLDRLIKLQNRVGELENQQRDPHPVHLPVEKPSREPDPWRTDPTQAPALAPTPEPVTKAAAISGTEHTIAATLDRQAKQKGRTPKTRRPGTGFKLGGKLGEFLMRGNPIVKIAVVVLFFGVAFLFKYVADKNIFPIEWRLISIAVAAIAMLLWGLKLRHKQTLYALVIQGGALGLLYLTVFAAAKFYALLPLSAALIMMVALVALSGYLAIWQDSKSLAIFSTVGGFLAPVLTATDSGSHVQLFSYYAVLNLGILGISWFKAWRLLIWLGFIFTFLIGATWGYFDYRPEMFSSTEPFLIFFTLLYLCIPVLYLRKQGPENRGILDGSVVFGLPTLSFMMQYQLIEGRFVNGDAWSALAWGLAYLGAVGLMRWRPLAGSTTLRLSYTAIALVFLTLAVFFAFSKDVTSVFWALEGAGLVWLGCRQKQLLPRAAGIGLQLLSGIIFAEHYGKIQGSTILLNTQFLVLACISLAVLCSGYLLHRSRHEILRTETVLIPALLSIGLATWYLGGTLDMFWYLKRPDIPLELLIFYSLTAIICLVAGRKLGWTQLLGSSQLVFLAGTIILLGNFADNSYVQPMKGLGWTAYPIMLASMGIVLRYQELKTAGPWPALLHSVTVLNLVFLFGWIISTGVTDLAGDRDWYPIMWGLAAIIALFILCLCRNTLSWPVRPFENIYTALLPAILAGSSCLWILVSSWQLIQPHDWSYYPILNPLEVVHLGGFWVLSKWAMQETPRQDLKRGFLQYLFPFLVFIWINSLVAKSVHYWAGVRFDLSTLLAYPMFQAATSVLWSALALIFVTLARKKLSRKLWLIGIVLLAAVVLKLLLFDLVDTGTLGRIISFLAVGVLMLVIGYIAPMPPKPEAKAVP